MSVAEGLHARDARRRRAGRSRGGAAGPRGTRTPITGDVAGSIGFDAITGRPARPGHPAGHRARRPAVRCAERRRRADAGQRRARRWSLTQVLQALIVLFVAAPALVRGGVPDQGHRWRRHRHGEGVGIMSTAHRGAPAAAPERSRSATGPTCAARSAGGRVVAIGGPAALVFALTIENETVQYVLGERVSQDFPAGDLNGRPGWCGRPSRPRWSRWCWRCSTGCRGLGRRRGLHRGRARVLRRLPRSGPTPTRPALPGGDHQPAPGHHRDRHPADPRRAGGSPVRALGCHQHRHRGPVPRRCVLRLGGVASSSSAPRWASSAACVAGVGMAAMLACSRCATWSTRWSSASC